MAQAPDEMHLNLAQAYCVLREHDDGTLGLLNICSPLEFGGNTRAALEAARKASAQWRSTMNYQSQIVIAEADRCKPINNLNGFVGCRRVV